MLGRMRPTLRHLIPSLLLVAGVAACAGDEPQTPMSASSLPPAASATAGPGSASAAGPIPGSPQRSTYIEQANAICSQATERLTGLQQPQSVEALTGFIQQTLEIQDSTLDQIEQLEAPPADADRLRTEFLDRSRGQQQELQGLLRDVRAAVETRDEQQLLVIGQRVLGITDPALETFLGDYGLIACRDLGKTAS